MLLSVLIKDIEFDIDWGDENEREADAPYWIERYYEEEKGRYTGNIYKINIDEDDNRELDRKVEERLLEHITGLSGWFIKSIEYQVLENRDLEEMYYKSPKRMMTINFAEFYEKLLEERKRQHL